MPPPQKGTGIGTGAIRNGRTALSVRKDARVWIESPDRCQSQIEILGGHEMFEGGRVKKCSLVELDLFGVSDRFVAALRPAVKGSSPRERPRLI